MNGSYHNYHNTFVIAIIVIIVIFVFLLFGCLTMKESFTNPGMKPLTKNPFLNAKKTNSQFIDSYVPSNLGYSDITTYYNSMDNTLKGTSLVNVSAVDSKRYPIMIETPTNWYNTQPMVLKDINVGSNWGKLPMSDCICRDGNSLEFGI